MLVMIIYYNNFITLQISSNGLISFVSGYLEFEPQTFPISRVVISPYWDDIDLRESGGVYYNSYTPKNGSDVLEHMQTFLMRNQSIHFTAKSVVIIKWMDVCPYINQSCVYVSIVNNYHSKLTAQTCMHTKQL